MQLSTPKPHTSQVLILTVRETLHQPQVYLTIIIMIILTNKNHDNHNNNKDSKINSTAGPSISVCFFFSRKTGAIRYGELVPASGVLSLGSTPGRKEKRGPKGP